MNALNRYAKSERSAVARAWGKRSAASREATRLAAGVDADTLRARLRDMQRGLPVADFYSARGHIRIARSVAGRTDQFDVLVDGSLWLTCGPRKLPGWLGLRNLLRQSEIRR